MARISEILTEVQFEAAPVDLDRAEHAAADIFLVDAYRARRAEPIFRAAERWKNANPGGLVAALFDPPALLPADSFETIAECLYCSLDQPAAVVKRLTNLVRLRNISDEAQLRARSYVSIGGRGALSALEETRSAVDRTILVFGGPTEQFLPLQHALAQRQTKVIAAMTPGAAIDYLDRANIDALVAFASRDAMQALNLCAVIRRNTRLHDTPSLVVLDRQNAISEEDAYRRGAADVARSPIESEELARRLAGLANRVALARQLRRFLLADPPEGAMDEETRLMNARFFNTHYKRQSLAADMHHRPISLLTLRIRNRVGQKADKGAGLALLKQAADAVRLLVRAEDLVTRLADDVILVSLPATRIEDARMAAKRIVGVVSHTQFLADTNSPPMIPQIEFGASERRTKEPIEETVARALAGLAFSK